MKTEEKYLQFPLFLLRNLFIDKHKTINDIFKYGIYKYSKTVKYELYEVARQLMYVYYRLTSYLPNDLLECLEKHIDDGEIVLDEDYNGFSGSEFNPEQEIECLLKLFDADEDFKAKSIELYQIKIAYKNLGFTPIYNFSLKGSKVIELLIPDKEVMPMVSKSLLLDFRDNNKTEYELIQFAAYISVRSIIGKNKFYGATKMRIIRRMFGYKGEDDLPDKLPIKINLLFDKYVQRHHWEKIRNILEKNWNVMFYSNNLGCSWVAIQTEKFTIKNLIYYAELEKKKNKDLEMNKIKAAAKVEALKLIKLQH